MLSVLRVLLMLLGIAAVAIALSIVFAGPAATAHASSLAYAAAMGAKPPAAVPWPPTMDSELRFYAPFWGTYGIILLLVARALPRRLALVPWLAVLFFAGGVGRAISYAAVGAPDPVFTLLMGIELVLPAVFLALWGAARLTRQAP